MKRSFGLLVLGIYLILYGLSGFVDIGELATVLDVLAIAAGVLILLGR